MPQHVAHFSINADDVARARRFYEKALGWKFNAWGPPRFYMIETGPDQPVLGSLQGRRELIAGQRTIGFECTVGVESIDETERAIVAAGGRIIMPRSVIPGVGTLLFFADTEGNAVGAMQYDRSAT
ncbi:MAG TPA: VOC family protein [Kofleriaceae bacterium]|nr:VOC family protein [Kofleriaceae bacterium]